MASSGTIQQAIRMGYRLQIAWSVGSQSVANNTSSVTAKVQLVSTGSSYTINSSASKSGSLTINGTKYSFTFTAALSGNQTKTLFTKTVTVSHNSDGTKVCSFSATCGINVTLSGTYYGNVTASGSGTFNTIARASSISSVTSSVSVTGSNAVTVNIDRKSSSFTHTVVFSFGSYSKTATGVGTSTSYTIPQSWLNAMPSATSGTAKVTVTTYSGSTKIGAAVSKKFTITVPASVVPAISSVAVADTVTAVYSFFGNMVQSKSQPKFTITAAGAFSSTIKTYTTVFEGKSYSGATPTAGVITGSGTVSAKITVTDSRGRSASTTKTWTVLPYSPPKIISFQGFRCLADGTENYEGAYLNAAINFSIAPVSDKNTAAYTLEYKLQSATTWTNLTSGAIYALKDNVISASGIFGLDNSYDVRLSVTDHFATVRSIIEISTAFTLLDFNANGKALAFGKVSELTEGVEFALPVKSWHGELVNSPIMLPPETDMDTLLEPGYYCVANTTSSPTVLNKPSLSTTATAFVEVLLGGDGLQRVQRFTQCDKDDQYVWQRCYYTGAWGGWQMICGGTKKITITPETGVTISRASASRSGDIATMYINLHIDKDIAAATGTLVATIPVEQCPLNSVATVGVQGATGTCVCWVRKTGMVYVRTGSAYTAGAAIEFSLTWNITAPWQI